MTRVTLLTPTLVVVVHEPHWILRLLGVEAFDREAVGSVYGVLWHWRWSRGERVPRWVERRIVAAMTARGEAA